MRRQLFHVTLIGLTGLGLLACDTGETETEADAGPAGQDQAGDGESDGQWNPISSSRVFPPEPARGSFTYTKGPHEGTISPYRVRKGEQSDGDGQRFELLIEDRLHQFFVRDEQGRVFVERVDNFDRNVRVLFDPPILALPARLTPTSRNEQTVDITVKNLDTGDVRTSGQCKATLKKITRQTVNTPAGEFEVYLMHLSRVMDMNLANVDLTLENGYAPGKGLVVSESERTTHIGWFDRNQTNRYERGGEGD